jgi:hypothetical protein
MMNEISILIVPFGVVIGMLTTRSAAIFKDYELGYASAMVLETILALVIINPVIGYPITPSIVVLDFVFLVALLFGFYVEWAMEILKFLSD